MQVERPVKTVPHDICSFAVKATVKIISNLQKKVKKPYKSYKFFYSQTERSWNVPKIFND